MRREILIDSAAGEVRVAVVEDELLAEILVERPGRGGVAGNIYKGRISNILPGMQSAFVDIGLPRDAFLYVEDLGGGVEDDERLLGLEADEEAAPAESHTSPPPRGSIEDLLKAGQEIVVQVAKDAVAQKGARITSHLSLPGRFLVYLPAVAHVGVSRRIQDPAERERLKTAVQALIRERSLPGGFIVRTAGEGQRPEDFVEDARYLSGLWEEIRRRADAASAPALLHAEVGAVAKVLRDVLNHDVHQVLVDAEDVHREALEFVGRMQPSLAHKIRLYSGDRPLFEERGVQPQLDRALRSRVWLKSGGYIVLNQTEALVAIDVNTGKYVGRRRLEETILRTNLEAVREIVRQVRLRDLGGIIVIDFIDMQEATSKAEVIQALEQELRRDRSKSRMLQISEFGLVEITRQRTKRSLERLLCAPCPACAGSGRVKSPETIYFEILRQAGRLRPAAGGRIVARVHPEMAARLAEVRESLSPTLGPAAREAARVEVQPDPGLGYDQFSVTAA
jgi:ribonuclease G